MTEMLNLLDMLREIEDITDLNGCFFVNTENNNVIESTIHSPIPKNIIWEIGVLKDTFQHFANEVHHGETTEIMLEGDKGYVLMYNLPHPLILLTMGSYDLNLSYVKLAMIDILKRIRERIVEIGDELLMVPTKELGAVTTRMEMEPIPVTPEPIIPEKITPELEIGEDLNILTLINSLENKSDEDKHITFKKIFYALKDQIKSLSGVEFSKLLDVLKDAILTYIGTSLALFDISKHSRDISKIDHVLSPEVLKKYYERIDNWESRILKL